MSALKIPRYNDELDLKLAKYVFLKKLPIVLLIFVFALTVAFLVLRYTQPLYESKTIIQVESESKAEMVFKMESSLNEQITQKIELLRSKVFINSVLAQMPLDVSYFSKGKFLNFELYKTSPFEIQYKILNEAIYGVPVFIEYEKDSIFSFSYIVPGSQSEIKVNQFVELNKWFRFKDFDLKMKLNDNLSSTSDLFDSQGKYFFVINKPENLYRQYAPKISANVLSDVAKTILVSVRDNNSIKASDIANTIADQFQYFDIEKRSKSANKILEFIEDQLLSVELRLSELKEEIINYKQQYKIEDDVDFKMQRSYTVLVNIEEEISKLSFEQSMLNNVVKELNSKSEIDPELLITILTGSQYGQILSQFTSSISQLLVRKEQLLNQANPNSTFISSIDNQIDTQKSLFLKSLQRIKSNNEARISELKLRYNNQYDDLFELDKSSSFELIQLEQQYSITEKFYNQLIEKKIEFSILRAGFVPENIILERAVSQGLKVYPNKNKVLSISILIAFFVSFVILALYYINYNGIVNASEINKYTSLPVLGVIPKFVTEIPLSHFVVEKYPRSILAESFRSVRSNLQFIDNSKGSKIVAVTSTMSGEGKTFFSINLAGALAVSGFKVIILDLDMRKPNVHKYLKLNNEIGMSSLLSKQTNIDDCTQQTKNDNVKFISAGPIPPNPSELIQNGEIEHILDQLKQEFDYIFIDNPPIGLVSDSLKTIQIADYPIFILRANYSKRNFLTLPEKIYIVYGIKKLSIVLNAFDDKVSNIGIEKDLVYAYSYVKGISKSGKSSYYDEDLPENISLFRKIFNYYFKK